MFTLERVQNINVAEFFQLPVLMAPDYTFSNRKKKLSIVKYKHHRLEFEEREISQIRRHQQVIN